VQSDDDSDGFWSRIIRIRFLNSFKKDPAQQQKLYDAAEGVLAWIVEGARLWFANGMLVGSHPLIESATKEYRASADQLTCFLSECCATSEQDQTVTKKTTTTLAALWDAYESWSEDNLRQRERWKKTALSTALARRFARVVDAGEKRDSIGFRGVRLKSPKKRVRTP
jgi:phage/plasmid-associated DNA primase